MRNGRMFFIDRQFYNHNLANVFVYLKDKRSRNGITNTQWFNPSASDVISETRFFPKEDSCSDKIALGTTKMFIGKI